MDILEGYSQGEIATNQTVAPTAESIAAAAPKFFEETPGASYERYFIQFSKLTASTKEGFDFTGCLKESLSEAGYSVLTYKYDNSPGHLRLTLYTMAQHPRALLQAIMKTSLTPEVCEAAAVVHANYSEVVQFDLGCIEKGAFTSIAIKNLSKATKPQRNPTVSRVPGQAPNHS